MRRQLDETLHFFRQDRELLVEEIQRPQRKGATKKTIDMTSPGDISKES